MSVIDPRTGKPIKKLTDTQLLQTMSSFDQQLKWLAQQNMQISLYVDWIVENLQKANDAYETEHGTPFLTLDPEEFPEFAEQRYKEIQEQAIQEQLDQLQATVEATKSESESESDITEEDLDLSDEK